MTVESLKRDARRHEQREEWIKALDLYLQAIERQEEEGEPDIALHNRVGDIQVRVGDVEGAMGSYERAIDLYTAAELPNNAIAICRKMIRHDPERPEPYLRLGQIRAGQGFAVDARENFISYAEMMQARGESDEALRSLRELVGLAPADVDTRVFVAELLASRGESDDALAYLVEAYQISHDHGLDEEQAILVRIREIDPDHPVPSVGGLATSQSEDEDRMEEAFEGYALATDEPDGVSGGLGSTPVAGEDALVLDTGPADDLSGGEGWSSSGLGSTELDLEPELDGAEEDAEEDAEEPSLGTPSGVDESWLLTDEPDATEPETTEVEAESDADETDWSEPIVWEGAEDESGDRSGLTLDVGPAEHGDWLEEAEPLKSDDPEVSAFESEVPEGFEPAVDATEGTGETFDLSGLGLQGEEEEEEVEAENDLPYLHFDPDSLDAEEPEVAPEPALVGGEPEVPESVGVSADEGGTEPTSAEDWRKLGDELFQAGDQEGGRDALEKAHRLYADNGEPEKGVGVIRELLIHEPHRIELRQRAVEYAHQSNESTLLVEAFLELADGLRAAGESEKAAAVFRQVLEIDPRNLRANEGVAPAPGSAEAAQASDEYVDLGAMVLDEEGERTTRWTVPAEEPTGDEEADFAKMLSQFKEKVAENISSDDAQSHYDLGAAYKDMGLIQEAIGEFQQALRAQPNHLATFEMLGECFLEMGDADVAIRTLERGLTLETEVEDDLLGIYYWLAKANEGVGKSDTAREFYERIFSLDINFKDVVERLKALR